MADVKLEWSNNQDVCQIDAMLVKLLERILQVAAKMEELAEGEISLAFVNDGQIRELNYNYRGVDRPTDVLSFPLNESFQDGERDIIYELGGKDELHDMNNLLGDIIISAERAQEQANHYGHSLEREIGFLFVHGFLHLLGYNHQDEGSEQVMIDKQEAVLAEVGLCC